MEFNGIHLVADTNAVADANSDAQCEWALTISVIAMFDSSPVFLINGSKFKLA